LDWCLVPGGCRRAHGVLVVGGVCVSRAKIRGLGGGRFCFFKFSPPLAEAAAKVLRDIRYDNVSVEIGDGYHGWLECGPFDAIVVTAALGRVPPPLIEQLKVGGRLVMPLGSIERHSNSPWLKRSRQVKRGCAPLPLCASCPSPGPRIER